MTTIAYRDGVLASDSQVTNGWTIVATTQKVAKSSSGRLVGAAGTALYGQQLRLWADKDGTLEDLPHPADESSVGVLIDLDGSVTYIQKDGHTTDTQYPFFATGSGKDYALGAMGHGATAEEAVAIAIRLDCGSGGEVQSVRLGGSQ